MSDQEDSDDLVGMLCRKHGVPRDLVDALLALQDEFPDIGVWGAKAGMLRRVSELVAQAAATDGMT